MRHWGTRLHAAVYRRTHGRVLGRMAGQPVLLLETVGRRSGQRRTTPVQYLATGETFVVVASDGGSARPPAWYLNLLANPHARVQAGPRSIDVRAQETAGQQRIALWQQLTAANRYLERAARKAGRELPVMALVALDADDSAASHGVSTRSREPTRRFARTWSRDSTSPSGATSATPSVTARRCHDGVRVKMRGRIKVGVWLPFTAEQTVDGRSFTWRARVGLRSFTPLRVTDRYADAAGSTEGRLLGRATLFHAATHDTARSAATRAAIESAVFAPLNVLPGRGVTWRAETDSVIVADFDLPPEHPEVRVRIDEHGAIRTVSALRWGNAGEKTFRYIPFGGDVHDERRFGEFVLPAPSPSAGGSTPRATHRSSSAGSAPSRRRSNPSNANATLKVHAGRRRGCSRRSGRKELQSTMIVSGSATRVTH